VFVESAGADERVVVRDGVVSVIAAAVAIDVDVDVDTQDAPEEVLADVLAVAARVGVVPVLDVASALVAAATAVADSDVEGAIGTEGDGARVMVRLRFGNLQQGRL